MKKNILFLSAIFCCQFAMGQFSIQNALVEEHTGAWCQYCPDGAVILDQVLSANDHAIGVSVHNGDAMTIPVGDTLGAFYITGYPMGTVNRGAGLNRGQWMSATNSATAGAGAVTVSIDSLDFNTSTRLITVKINAAFTGPLTGDLRFNCIIVEDNINQAGSGYDQTNYYNTVAGHTYYGAGNPIIGFNHRHVAREYLGGAWGTPGIIPNSVSFGTTSSYIYTYTLPAGYDQSEIYIVALVSEFNGLTVNDRKVLNSEEIRLLTPAAINPSSTKAQFLEVYPNPMADRLNISFDLKSTSNLIVEVLNPLGQPVSTIANGIMNNGMHSLSWNGRDDKGISVANGLYFVRLATDDGQILTKRINLMN